YQGGVGRFTFRPKAQIDYHRLNEDGYTEKGGGKALDLTVDKRKSDELSGEAALALGVVFGEADAGWFQAELEGGRREILSGGLGATTARFADGKPFTLTPEERTSGWLARLRGIGGTEYFRLAGELSGEEQQGRAAVAARVTLQIGL
ncbi:MAG TPA: autotransporter outer membrane beta-barrel domain-containing protein, partial [Sphingomonas sp.]